MLVERDLSKGAENMKLRIETFVFGANKQTNKTKAQTKKDKETLIGRNEIMDFFICSADAHAFIFFKASVSARCKNACPIFKPAPY